MDSSSTPEIADLLSEWDHLTRLLHTLDENSWAADSPCPGWTVHDVVAHVAGTEHLLCGDPAPEVEVAQAAPHVHNDIGTLNENAVVTMRSLTHTELLDDLESVLDRRRTALATMTPEQLDTPGWSPLGEVPHRVFLSIRTFDCWVHEQDIRLGAGLPLRLDGPTGARSMDLIVGALPRVVGKVAAAPEGSRVRFTVSGEQERVVDVVVTGGRADVAEVGGDPTITLSCDTATLVLAACGRRAASAVSGNDPATGEVDVDGDDALGRRIVDGMAFTI